MLVKTGVPVDGAGRKRQADVGRGGGRIAGGAKVVTSGQSRLADGVAASARVMVS